MKEIYIVKQEWCYYGDYDYNLTICANEEAATRIFNEKKSDSIKNFNAEVESDKIEDEFKAIENAQESLMKMDRSELTIPTLIKLTAESTGNVQDLVTEMINKGIDEEVMYDIMLNVTTDIANGGEISDATINSSGSSDSSFKLCASIYAFTIGVYTL